VLGDSLRVADHGGDAVAQSVQSVGPELVDPEAIAQGGADQADVAKRFEVVTDQRL